MSEAKGRLLVTVRQENGILVVRTFGNPEVLRLLSRALMEVAGEKRNSVQVCWKGGEAGEAANIVMVFQLLPAVLGRVDEGGAPPKESPPSTGGILN